TSQILGAWFDLQGRMLQPPFVVAPASRTTWNLNAATVQDGRVAVVFDAAFETGASELYLALIDQGTAGLQRLSGDDGHDSKYPDIAVRNDLAALSWHDALPGNNEIHLALFDIDA